MEPCPFSRVIPANGGLGQQADLARQHRGAPCPAPSRNPRSFMTDTHTHDAAKAKAEATFKRKEQQAREGAKAMSEYIAGQAALRARTERLRTERLAREAREAAGAASGEPAEAKPKKKAARRS